jgi:hypothetical protein
MLAFLLSCVVFAWIGGSDNPHDSVGRNRTVLTGSSLPPFVHHRIPYLPKGIHRLLVIASQRPLQQTLRHPEAALP